MNRAQTDQIWALHREGRSLRAIATELGMSRPTITRVIARGPVAPLELPAHMKTPELPASGDEPADNAPALEQVRYLMKEARAALRTAQACGDSQLAQRQTRNAVYLANVLARLEAAEAENDGGFHVTAAEIAKAQEMISTNVAGLAARGPVRCSRCSRVLSVSWGLGISEDEAEAFEADAGQP